MPVQVKVNFVPIVGVVVGDLVMPVHAMTGAAGEGLGEGESFGDGLGEGLGDGEGMVVVIDGFGEGEQGGLFLVLDTAYLPPQLTSICSTVPQVLENVTTLPVPTALV